MFSRGVKVEKCLKLFVKKDLAELNNLHYG